MAGPFDFTGQNIEDSYQRVLQTDGANLYDGTGSLFSLPSAFPYTGSALITGSLGVTGSISVNGRTGTGLISIYGDVGSTLRLNVGSSNPNKLQFTQEFTPGTPTEIGFVSNEWGTGMILSTFQDIIFKPGNTERAKFVGATGNFLVGTTVDSGYKLNVSGSALFQNGSTPLMIVSSSGVVTIGLSGSAYGSTGTSNGKLTINNTSGNNAIAIRAGETGYQLAIKTTVSDSIGAEFVWFDGATITFLQYGGGIGARLGASGFAQFRANNYTPDGNATIHTGNSNAERLRVTNAGLIGIGTTLPSASLHIKGATSSSLSSSLLIQNANNSSSFIVLDDGFVGVGTSTPTYKLTVQGTTLADSSVSSQGSFNLNPLTAPAAIGGYTLSAGSALGVGTYYYFVVYVTSLGETSAGSTLTVTTTTSNTTVNLTNIPISTDSRVLARKIYRTKVNFTSDNEWFLATINDNITTTYTDTTPDASLTGVGLQAYKVNTTSRYITTNGTQGMILDANLTALGLSAGRTIISSNAAAVRSVFIGALAGENVTTGTANVLIGGASGRNLTTGGSNTLIGDLAGFVISNASNNTAIGSQTARYLTTGGNNIIIGASSANVLTDGSTQFTQGTNNTILGNSIRMSTITDTNSIIIGNTAWGLGSNTAVLGNDSTTRTALRGNISIGTTGSISSTLHVKGSGATNATTALRVENSNGSASLAVLDNGNVGIGGEPIASTYKLRVYGTIWADSFAQLSQLAGYAGVGIIQYYDGGTTFRMRVYGTHPSEAVKGIISIDRQDLTYSGLENTITHTASFYQDHPSLVIRSNNTSANSFYLQNYMYASGALFVTSQPAGGDTSFRFKPSASITSSPDVFVINTSGVQVTGSLNVSGSARITNGLIISSSTTINDQLVINIPETDGPVDRANPAGFYKATVNGAVVYLPYYL
jgi:hypothetical protein